MTTFLFLHLCARMNFICHYYFSIYMSSSICLLLLLMLLFFVSFIYSVLVVIIVFLLFCNYESKTKIKTTCIFLLLFFEVRSSFFSFHVYFKFYKKINFFRFTRLSKNHVNVKIRKFLC